MRLTGLCSGEGDFSFKRIFCPNVQMFCWTVNKEEQLIAENKKDGGGMRMGKGYRTWDSFLNKWTE